MFRFFYIAVLILIFNGCSIRGKNYYILSDTTPIEVVSISKKISSIGVADIKLPEYLLKESIPVEEKDQKIIFSKSDFWGVSMDRELTNRLISYLQKRLNMPEVYNYPWGIRGQKVDTKLYLKISHFIAKEKIVYLDASWQWIDKNGDTKSYLFSKKVESRSKDIKDVIEAMNKIFRILEESIVSSMLK